MVILKLGQSEKKSVGEAIMILNISNQYFYKNTESGI